MRRIRPILLSSLLLATSVLQTGPVAAQDADARTTIVSGETLAELVVPNWVLPADPIGLVAGDWRLAEGTDVTEDPYVSQANEAMRSIAIVVTEGQYLIEPTTEAMLWRDLAAAPELTPATEAVTLGPGAAIYLPAIPADQVDPETYLRIANPGPGDATAWAFHVNEDSRYGFGGYPPGLRYGSWWGNLALLMNPAEWTAADEIHFRLARHDLRPGATYVGGGAPATEVFFVESGTIERGMRGPGAELRDRFTAGTTGELLAADDVEHTLTTVSDGPASVLVLSVVPRLPAE